MSTETQTRTIRQLILDAIRDDVPTSWLVVDGVWTVRETNKPVLWVEYSALAPSAVLPGSAVDVTVDVNIITPHQDFEKAEDQADEQVLVLYGPLLRAQNVTGVTAAKNVWAESFLGWRITVTVTLPNDLFLNPVDDSTPDPEV